jgi:hypothetical protein
MTELDPRLADAVRRLRALPPGAPGARERLRSALDHERTAWHMPAPAPPPGMLLLSRRAALAAAALLVLATSLLWAVLAQAGITTGAVRAAASARVDVQFVIVAQDARSVSLVGDFNDWNPNATPLVPSPGGVWSIVLPLESGRFTYSFLVDEREWRSDPQAPLVTDDFGRPSSVVFVAATEAD